MKKAEESVRLTYFRRSRKRTAQMRGEQFEAYWGIRTVNKNEQQIWKHLNGKRFLHKLEQVERGAGTSGNRNSGSESEQESDELMKKTATVLIVMPKILRSSQKG
ncbi:hypothetical protein Bca52824_016875 [Brassica carinata]|uniref:Uncharacterized protein n=1 Tax=Brassica carinata TaxID=52824 RepID=A0A8X8B6Y0_BRACI|nr:hypothetical protein Bca52824_016875 [Brassica carinata]